MRLQRRVLNIVMVLIGLLFISPLLFMVMTSFKRESEVLNPSTLIPHRWETSNYNQLFHSSAEAPIGLWFTNSIFVSCSITFLVLIVSSMAAFAITRMNVRGGRGFLTLVIGSMMIPPQLLLIPLYLILGRMKVLDTPYALILPAAAGGFGVFMLSQFMRSLPAVVEEQAMIDGCSLPQVYWRITLPLCGPVLATLGVFTFIASWNDYISPLVFMESVTNYTLPVGIAIFQTSYATQYGLTIATSLVSTLPLLIVFLVFQKQIIESMTSSGLKEA